MTDTSQKESVKSLSVDTRSRSGGFADNVDVGVRLGLRRPVQSSRAIDDRVPIMEQSLCQDRKIRVLRCTQKRQIALGRVRVAVSGSAHDALKPDQGWSAHDIGDGVFPQLVQENLLRAIECTFQCAASMQWTGATTAISHCTDTFHRGNHIADTKGISRNGKFQSAVSTADRIDISQLAKALRHLVHMVRRDVITLGNLCSADRFAVSNSSEINQQAKREISVKGKAHLRSRVVRLPNSNLKTGLIFYPDG